MFAIRLPVDVDRVARLVGVRPDDRGVDRVLTLHLVLDHGHGGVRPLVPPLVALAVGAGILLHLLPATPQKIIQAMTVQKM